MEESKKEPVGNITTRHFVNVTLKNGEVLELLMWRGVICSKEGTNNKYAIMVAKVAPPLAPKSSLFKVEMKNSNGQTVFSVLLEASIYESIRNDVVAVSQLHKLAVGVGFLPDVSLKEQNLTPTKSPAKKKAKVSETRASSAKASLDFGNQGDLGGKSMAGLGGLELLAAIATDSGTDGPLDTSPPAPPLPPPAATPSPTNLGRQGITPVPNIVTKFLRSVLVTLCNFHHSTFDPVDFQKFLEDMARLYEFALDEDKVVDSVQDWNPDTVECVVQFSNEHIARRLCSIVSLEYNGAEVFLAQEMVMERGGQQRTRSTRQVRVTNLPPKFFEAHFIHHLHEAMVEAGILLPAEEAVECCSMYDQHMRSCSVEFKNETYAQSVAALGHIQYDRYTVNFQVIEEHIYLKPSKSVRFSNLPKNFFQAHFANRIDSIVSELEGKEIVNAVKCVTYCPEEGNCVVEFSDEARARRIVDMHTIIYDKKALQFELIQEEVAVKPTCVVTVHNLPNFFHEIHFREHLNEMACLYRLVSDDALAVKHIADYAPENNSCTVEFSNSFIAEQMVAIRPHVYGRRKIMMELRKEKETSTSLEISPDAHDEGLSSEDGDDKGLTSDDAGDEGMTNEDSEDGGINADTMEEINPLETNYEILAFLHVFVKHKKARPYAKLDTLYSLVVGDLDKAPYNIVTSEKQCKLRKKTVEDAYRRHKKNYGEKTISWPFFCIVSQMRNDDTNCAGVGHYPADCPSQLNKHPNEKSKPLLVRSSAVRIGPDTVGFTSKGTFVTVEAQRVLIEVLIEFAPKMEELKKKAQLWEDIRSEMARRGFQYHRGTLIDAWEKLSNKYNAFKSRLGKTGQGFITWEFFDDMDRLLKANVNVCALLTVAAGTTTEMKVRNDCEHEERKIEKRRPATNPRKPQPKPNKRHSNEHPEPKDSDDWKVQVGKCLSTLVDFVVQNKGKEN